MTSAALKLLSIKTPPSSSKIVAYSQVHHYKVVLKLVSHKCILDLYVEGNLLDTLRLGSCYTSVLLVEIPIVEPRQVESDSLNGPDVDSEMQSEFQFDVYLAHLTDGIFKAFHVKDHKLLPIQYTVPVYDPFKNGWIIDSMLLIESNYILLATFTGDLLLLSYSNTSPFTWEFVSCCHIEKGPLKICEQDKFLVIITCHSIYYALLKSVDLIRPTTFSDATSLPFFPLHKMTQLKGSADENHSKISQVTDVRSHLCGDAIYVYFKSDPDKVNLGKLVTVKKKKEASNDEESTYTTVNSSLEIAFHSKMPLSRSKGTSSTGFSYHSPNGSVFCMSPGGFSFHTSGPGISVTSPGTSFSSPNVFISTSKIPVTPAIVLLETPDFTLCYRTPNQLFVRFPAITTKKKDKEICLTLESEEAITKVLLEIKCSSRLIFCWVVQGSLLSLYQFEHIDFKINWKAVTSVRAIRNIVHLQILNWFVAVILEKYGVIGYKLINSNSGMPPTEYLEPLAVRKKDSLHFKVQSSIEATEKVQWILVNTTFDTVYRPFIQGLYIFQHSLDQEMFMFVWESHPERISLVKLTSRMVTIYVWPFTVFSPTCHVIKSVEVLRSIGSHGGEAFLDFRKDENLFKIIDGTNLPHYLAIPEISFS